MKSSAGIKPPLQSTLHVASTGGQQCSRTIHWEQWLYGSKGRRTAHGAARSGQRQPADDRSWRRRTLLLPRLFAPRLGTALPSHAQASRPRQRLLGLYQSHVCVCMLYHLSRSYLAPWPGPSAVISGERPEGLPLCLCAPSSPYRCARRERTDTEVGPYMLQVLS